MVGDQLITNGWTCKHSLFLPDMELNVATQEAVLPENATMNYGDSTSVQSQTLVTPSGVALENPREEVSLTSERDPVAHDCASEQKTQKMTDEARRCAPVAPIREVDQAESSAVIRTLGSTDACALNYTEQPHQVVSLQEVVVQDTAVLNTVEDEWTEVTRRTLHEAALASRPHVPNRTMLAIRKECSKQMSYGGWLHSPVCVQGALKCAACRNMRRYDRVVASIAAMADRGYFRDLGERYLALASENTLCRDLFWPASSFFWGSEYDPDGFDVVDTMPNCLAWWGNVGSNRFAPLAVDCPSVSDEDKAVAAMIAAASGEPCALGARTQNRDRHFHDVEMTKTPGVFLTVDKQPVPPVRKRYVRVRTSYGKVWQQMRCRAWLSRQMCVLQRVRARASKQGGFDPSASMLGWCVEQMDKHMWPNPCRITETELEYEWRDMYARLVDSVVNEAMRTGIVQEHEAVSGAGDVEGEGQGPIPFQRHHAPETNQPFRDEHILSDTRRVVDEILSAEGHYFGESIVTSLKEYFSSTWDYVAKLTGLADLKRDLVCLFQARIINFIVLIYAILVRNTELLLATLAHTAALWLNSANVADHITDLVKRVKSFFASDGSADDKNEWMKIGNWQVHRVWRDANKRRIPPDLGFTQLNPRLQSMGDEFLLDMFCINSKALVRDVDNLYMDHVITNGVGAFVRADGEAQGQSWWTSLLADSAFIRIVGTVLGVGDEITDSKMNNITVVAKAAAMWTVLYKTAAGALSWFKDLIGYIFLEVLEFDPFDGERTLAVRVGRALVKAVDELTVVDRESAIRAETLRGDIIDMITHVDPKRFPITVSGALTGALRTLEGKRGFIDAILKTSKVRVRPTVTLCIGKTAAGKSTLMQNLRMTVHELVYKEKYDDSKRFPFPNDPKGFCDGYGPHIRHVDIGEFLTYKIKEVKEQQVLFHMRGVNTDAFHLPAASLEHKSSLYLDAEFFWYDSNCENIAKEQIPLQDPQAIGTRIDFYLYVLEKTDFAEQRLLVSGQGVAAFAKSLGIQVARRDEIEHDFPGKVEWEAWKSFRGEQMPWYVVTPNQFAVMAAGRWAYHQRQYRRTIANPATVSAVVKDAEELARRTGISFSVEDLTADRDPEDVDDLAEGQMYSVKPQPHCDILGTLAVRYDVNQDTWTDIMKTAVYKVKDKAIEYWPYIKIVSYILVGTGLLSLLWSWAYPDRDPLHSTVFGGVRNAAVSVAGAASGAVSAVTSWWSRPSRFENEPGHTAVGQSKVVRIVNGRRALQNLDKFAVGQTDAEAQGPTPVASMNMDDVVRSDMRACVDVLLEYPGVTVVTHGVFVAPRILMMVSHGLTDAIIGVKIKDTNPKHDANRRFIPRLIVVDEEQDLAFVVFGDDLLPHQSITKRLWPTVLNTEYKEKELFMVFQNPGKCQSTVYPVIVTGCESLPYRAEGRTYTPRSMLRYMAATKRGDCGTLMYEQGVGAAHVVGMHVAGTSTGEGYCVTLDATYIGKWLTDIQNKTGERTPELPDADAEGQGSYPVHVYPALGEFHGHEVVGQVPWAMQQSLARKSKITASPYHALAGTGPFGDCVYMPAVLKADPELGDPLIPGLNKMNNTCQNYTWPFLEEALRDFATMYPSPAEPKVGTLHDAVFAINRHTGKGYPWTRGRDENGRGYKSAKSDEIEVDKVNNTFKISDRLQRYIDYRLVQASLNKRVWTIWAGALKDELRPRQKVLDRKTRYFSAGPVDYTLVMHMYMNQMVQSVQEQHNKKVVAIGINPHGCEWMWLYLRLAAIRAFGKKGGEQDRHEPLMAARRYAEDPLGGSYVETDGSNWDGSCHPKFRRAFEAIHTWYKGVGEDVRRVLLEELINSFHIIGDVVFSVHGSHPSGDPITSFLNSLYMFLLLDSSIRAVAHRHGFDIVFDMMVMAIYGDDNIAGLPYADFPWHELTPYVKDTFGVTLTSGEKTTEVYSKPLEDMKFLGRSFTGLPTNAPITKERLEAIFMWVAAPDRETLQATIYGWAIEASHHSEEYYMACRDALLAHPISQLWNIQIPLYMQAYMKRQEVAFAQAQCLARDEVHDFTDPFDIAEHAHQMCDTRWEFETTQYTLACQRARSFSKHMSFTSLEEEDEWVEKVADELCQEWCELSGAIAQSSEAKGVETSEVVNLDKPTERTTITQFVDTVSAGVSAPVVADDPPVRYASRAFEFPGQFDQPVLTHAVVDWLGSTSIDSILATLQMTDVFGTQMFMDVVKRFSYWSADYWEVTVRINVPRTQFGCLLMSYAPIGGFNCAENKVGFGGTTNQFLAVPTTLQQPATFKVPFVHPWNVAPMWGSTEPNPRYTLPNAAYNPGTIVVSVLNPLQGTQDDEVPRATISIYQRLVGLKLYAPNMFAWSTLAASLVPTPALIAERMRAATGQSGRDKESDARSRGLADATGHAHEAIMLWSKGRTASAVLTGLRGVTGLVGFNKTTDERVPMMTVPTTQNDMTNCDTPTPRRTLLHHVGAHTARTSRGMPSNGDEMKMSFVTRVPSLAKRIKLNRALDSELFRIYPTMTDNKVTDSGKTTIGHTLLGQVSRLFRWYSGSMDLMFHIVSSPFITARLTIELYPHMLLTEVAKGVDYTDAVFRKVLDVQGESMIRFKVPNGSPFGFAPTDGLTMTAATPMIRIAAKGSITGTDVTADPYIWINVYVAGGEDFRLYAPRVFNNHTPGAVSTDTGAPAERPAPRVRAATGQVDVRAMYSHSAEWFDPSMTTQECDGFAWGGDRIESLAELARTPYWHGKRALTWATIPTGTGTGGEMYIVGRFQPRWRIDYFNLSQVGAVRQAGYGQLGENTSGRMFAYIDQWMQDQDVAQAWAAVNDPFQAVVRMYRYYRGSLDVGFRMNARYDATVCYEVRRRFEETGVASASLGPCGQPTAHGIINSGEILRLNLPYNSMTPFSLLNNLASSHDRLNMSYGDIYDIFLTSSGAGLSQVYDKSVDIWTSAGDDFVLSSFCGQPPTQVGTDSAVNTGVD